MSNMTAIIADDEANLLSYLREMLQRLWPELEIVGTATNGMEALSLVRDVEPDIAFLDIRMPVLTGLQVAKRIKGECHVVFITAYDEYAVQAFEEAATDYLLKPLEESRLLKTIERLKTFVDKTPVDTDLALLIDRISQQHGASSQPQYLNWIHAGDSEQMEMVPVDEVIYFKAEDKYTTVVTRDKEYLIRKSIRELAVELDPDQFWQIHRGTIVQVRQISSLKKAMNGTCTVLLKNRDDRLTVSRRYAHLFKQM